MTLTWEANSTVTQAQDTGWQGIRWGEARVTAAEVASAQGPGVYVLQHGSWRLCVLCGVICLLSVSMHGL